MSEKQEFQREKVDLPYYSFDKVLSYNAPFTFVCGARGLGKTYGATRDAVRAWTRTREQFIYMRRFDSELDSRHTFFNTIGHEFPDWDFRIHGRVGQAAHVSTRDSDVRQWHNVVHFLSLTQAQSKKSQDFNSVTRVIFDEFIIEKGYHRYINGMKEASVFLGFFLSISRYSNKVRAIFLSNSVSIMNPYFSQYEIEPDSGDEFIRKFDGFVVAHIVDSKSFTEAVKNTQLGRFMLATDPEYAKYAIDNAFADNHDDMVRPKNPSARYLYSIETVQGTFSIWKETLGNQYYAQAKRPKKETVFTLIPANISETKALLVSSDKLLRTLHRAWRTGRIYFDTRVTRNMFTEIFK